MVSKKKPGTAAPAGGITGSCINNFIVVYSDPGKGEHNVGNSFKNSAETHVDEIKNNKFPGIPHYNPKTDCNPKAVHISTASQLEKEISVGNVKYLAYFGNSWSGNKGEQRGTGETVMKMNNDWGIMEIGENSGADTNLGEPWHEKFKGTPVSSIIHKDKFVKTGAQIRLFGCRGGRGNNPVAKQIADHTKIPTYAYPNEGGSLFTHDQTLGYGRRSITKDDLKAHIDNKTPTWLVNVNGSTFKKF